MSKGTKGICPSCGVNRDALVEMLREPPIMVDNGYGWEVSRPHPDRVMALTLIVNCPACRAMFRRHGLILENKAHARQEAGSNS